MQGLLLASRINSLQNPPAPIPPARNASPRCPSRRASRQPVLRFLPPPRHPATTPHPTPPAHHELDHDHARVLVKALEHNVAAVVLHRRPHARLQQLLDHGHHLHPPQGADQPQPCVSFVTMHFLSCMWLHVKPLLPDTMCSRTATGSPARRGRGERRGGGLSWAERGGARRMGGRGCMLSQLRSSRTCSTD